MSDRLEKAYRQGEIGEREREEAQDRRDEWHLWNKIANDLHELVHEANKFFKSYGKTAASGFRVFQLGASMNNSIVAGAVGNFTATIVPAGGQLAAGAIPVWSSDDPLTTLTADPTGLLVAVATSATDTATSFNLTITGVALGGAAISQVTNVALTPAVVVGVPATGFSVLQTS